MVEAHVHGLPAPNVKFYRDGHLLHARKNKIVFFTEKEIFQCLLVRPDASISGTYTVLAENKAGKKRFDHHVDFVTKYPLIHLPGMRHADKKLEDFVELMLEKIPKEPEPVPVEVPAPVEAEVKPEEEVAPKEGEEAKAEIPEAPKAEEIAEALQAVVEGETPKAEGEAAVPAPKEEKKKHRSKHRHHHKKRTSSPKIDADLVDDGEDEAANVEEPVVEYKRKFSTVVHEPYETETFRIFNAKGNLKWSGKLRNQTAIEGTTIKMLCAVTGPLPIIKWAKNGKPVPWGATVRNMSGEGLGIVIIEKIQRSDAGVYSCAARNGQGEITTEAVIKVIPRSTVPKSDESSPAFTRVLDEAYHHTEDDLVLEAHVRGVPEPKINWYKDGIELNKAMDNRYDFCGDHDGGYQFRIHKPNAADSALYACEAVNDSGKVKISHKVNFTNLERHTHPQFVYHKESFWQPTLKPVLEPEPVKEKSPVFEYISHISDPVAQLLEQARIEAEKIEEARREIERAEKAKLVAARLEQAREAKQAADKAAQDLKDAEAAKNPPIENGDGSGEGGEGNVNGDETKENISDEAPEAAEEEKTEEAEKKPEKRSRGPRRKRYEGPMPEPILIRDSVKNITKARV